MEISFLGNLKINEVTINNINKMRERRNGIKYYGKSADIEYAKIALDLLEEVYPILLRSLDGNL